MNALRRSHLFRILLLCSAVLFGQTSHAAQPARSVAAPGSLPSQVKLRVAQPEPRRQMVRRIAHTVPPRPAACASHFAFLSLDDASLRSRIAQQQVRRSFQRQESLFFQPHLRPYSLRL